MSEWTISVPRPNMAPILLSLGHETIRHIAVAIDDSVENIDFQSALAFHPSAAVRTEIARRDFIDAAAVAHLLNDPDHEVRRALIWSTAARQMIDQEWLVAACAESAQLAVDVAGEIAEFELIDPVGMLGQLALHSDPSMRAAVARCRAGGRGTLRLLARDADPEVRAAAVSTLNNW